MSDVSSWFQTNGSQAKGNSRCSKSHRKEQVMEAAKIEEEGDASGQGKKGKGTWGHIYNFLAMGGFLLVLVAIVGIIISILFK